MATLKKLRIYNLAMDGTVMIYSLTKNQKLSKDFVLIDQIRRAVLSIAANIAEGYGRRTKKDFAHFVSISAGSCSEVICFLEIIQRVYGVSTEKEIDYFNQLAKQIWSFRKSLLANK